MRNFKKPLIFCAIVVFIGEVLAFTMLPSSGFRVILHEVQEQDVNYDLVVVGQSHGETNYNPYILEEETGLASYNMSRRLLSMTDLYYLVKESNYKNSPQVIVMDMDSTYWVGEGFTNYFNDSYIYHHLNNPMNKLEYFLLYALENDYRTTLCPYIDIKNGLTNVVSTVDNKLSKEYREYSMEAVEMPSDHFEYIGKGFRHAVVRTGATYDIQPFDVGEISESALESFDKIVSYCNKHGIQLICVSSPLPKERREQENYEEVYRFFCDITEKYQVPYIDFNIQSYGLSWEAEDFMDSDGHMMGAFADDYSKTLGTCLQSTLEADMK